LLRLLLGWVRVVDAEVLDVRCSESDELVRVVAGWDLVLGLSL
jgi:hypothetical protein